MDNTIEHINVGDFTWINEEVRFEKEILEAFKIHSSLMKREQPRTASEYYVRWLFKL